MLSIFTPTYKLPKKPLSRFELTLFRFSSVEPDYDGLVSGFKVIVDGLREIGVIAGDKLSNTGPWRCHWFLAKPKAGFIRVVVREVIRDKYEEMGL